MNEWKESALKTLNTRSIAFSPDNSLIATCSNSDCILSSTIDGKRLSVLEHSESLIAAFFYHPNELWTISERGQLTEWSIVPGGDNDIIDQRRFTAFPVRRVFWIAQEKKCFLVVGQSDKSDKNDISVLLSDKTLEQITELPVTITMEQIAVTNSIIAYCIGKEVHVLSIVDNSVQSNSTYCNKLNITNDKSADNIFVRLVARNDTVAAILSIGRIYVWQNTVLKGVHESTTSVHWHKVAAHLALSNTDGLFSAGAEATLCKWNLRGTRRPDMLPRLTGPVAGITLSDDASHVALLMEDNNVHVVLSSSMSVLSSLIQICYSGLSLHSIFTNDSRTSKCLVLNGRAGGIQWINPLESKTVATANLSLENAVDGDMSFSDIIHAHYDVEKVFLSTNAAASIERMCNFESDVKRFRIWGRNKGNAYTWKVLETINLSIDTVFLTGCSNPTTPDEEIFITTTQSGAISVWSPGSDGVRWRNDPAREAQWQGARLRCASSVHCGSLWASAHEGHPTDNIVLWDTNKMTVLDVVSTNGCVSCVEWATSNLVIFSTNESISCWNASSGVINWTVQQSLQIHIGSFGCFAWEKDHVIEFDPESGSLLDSIKASTCIEDLMAVRGQGIKAILVMKTNKGISALHPPIVYGAPSAKPVEATPFSRISAESRSSSTTTPVVNLLHRPPPSASKMMNAPCHSLPPISHIAPMFIAACLAPPPIRT